MARGIERRRLFRDDRDRDDSVRRLAALAQAGSISVYAWALLPNHFHSTRAPSIVATDVAVISSKTAISRSSAMLQVIQDVFAGGKEVIPGWRLLEHAKGALKRGGPDGLRRYYERCLDLNDPRGKRVKATLERTGRKTLESEYPRFMAAYNSGSK